MALNTRIALPAIPDNKDGHVASGRVSIIPRGCVLSVSTDAITKDDSGENIGPHAEGDGERREVHVGFLKQKRIAHSKFRQYCKIDCAPVVDEGIRMKCDWEVNELIA